MPAPRPPIPLRPAAYALGAAVSLLLATTATGQPDLTRQDVLTSAKRVYKDHANEITNKTAAEFEWFEGFRGFVKDSNASFAVVEKDVAVPKGRFFSLADTKARPGDMVRVKWAQKGEDKSALLIYAGEETFPDSDRKFSFFIYPYRTRLEYNTVPARKHRQYLKTWEDHWKITLDLLYDYTADKKREVVVAEKEIPTQWVKKGLWASHVFITTTMLNGTATYTLYRAKHDSSAAPYLTLKKPMIHHAQLTEDSCFFAAYADVATYKGLNQYGYTKGDARDLEKALIRDEVVHPASPMRRLAAAYFRAFLYTRDVRQKAELRKTKPGTKDAWSGPADESLSRALERGEFLGDWWSAAYGPRWNDFHLTDLYKDGVAPIKAGKEKFKTDFLTLAKESIQADEPLMLTIGYAADIKYLPDPDGPLKSATWVKHGHVGVEFKNPKKYGHWLVVTGVREEKGKTYIHFSTTMTGAADETGKFFVDLDHLTEHLLLRPDKAQKLDSEQLIWVKIPAGWKAGDAVPFDESEGLALAKEPYVPFLVKLTGKPVPVKENRPE
ncbi:MAG: hypothetical protein JWO38_133 [Gemmataceae bacterium]|nr:hypothetical protein [Gemmataceae bacterium]